MICDSRNLAKTSGTPGKTQLINHFEVVSASRQGGAETKWYLVDLPGYGFAHVSQSSRRRWQQMIENYLRKRENLGVVFILIDSRHPPQQVDLDFVNQLGKWEISFALVFTKSDKTTQREVSANVSAFLERLREHWEFLPTHFVTSALKKSGRKQLLEYIDNCNKEFRQVNGDGANVGKKRAGR